MRQAWITRPGPPEVLELREAPDPEPGQGQVRIRVRAAGVNFADVLGRMGLYPDAPKIPYVPGYEVAGTIEALGPGVSRSLAEPVLSFTRFGGYSDVVCVDAAQALPIPAGFAFERAAAIPVQYLTAWHMVVVMGNLREGETVLVHGLGGGVGIAALQIARARGARVLGTASPGKHAALRAQGADAVLDYGGDLVAAVRALTGGKGVQMVLDPVGGKSFRDSYRMLAPTGRLLVFGFSALAPGKRRSLWNVLVQLCRTPRFGPLGLMDRNTGVLGVNLGHLWSEVDLLRAEMQDILAGCARGELAPVVAQTFPLARAAEAHAFVQDRRNLGKVVLTA